MVRGYLVTVIVSELSVSGSETYLVIPYTKLSLWLFHLFGQESHRLPLAWYSTRRIADYFARQDKAWFPVIGNWYAKKLSKHMCTAWRKRFRFSTIFVFHARCLHRCKRLPKALSNGTRPVLTVTAWQRVIVGGTCSGAHCQWLVMLISARNARKQISCVLPCCGLIVLGVNCPPLSAYKF